MVQHRAKQSADEYLVLQERLNQSFDWVNREENTLEGCRGANRSKEEGVNVKRRHLPAPKEASTSLEDFQGSLSLSHEVSHNHPRAYVQLAVFHLPNI